MDEVFRKSGFGSERGEIMKTNLNRWRKAQTKEYMHYKQRVTMWESPESWERFLLENFSIDFKTFEDKKIVEIGCGAFGVVHYVNVPSFKVGVEPLCTNYSGLNDEYTCDTYQITSVGEHLPFKPKTFDVALSFNVLDHCFDPHNVLKEINRVLKEEGVLYLNVNSFDLPSWLRSKMSLFDMPHPHHFSHEELLSILEESGFSIDYHSKKRQKIEFKKLSVDFVHKLKYLIAYLLHIRSSFYICSNGGAKWR